MKRALYWAPAKLFSYTTLCFRKLEYATAARDPNCKDSSDIEQLQDHVGRRIPLVTVRATQWDDDPTTTMTTRSHTRGIAATFWTNNTQFHNSPLSRTIHDLKCQSEQTVSYNPNTGLTSFVNTIYIDRAYRRTCTYVPMKTDQEIDLIKKSLQQMVKPGKNYGFPQEAPPFH